MLGSTSRKTTKNTTTSSGTSNPPISLKGRSVPRDIVCQATDEDGDKVDVTAAGIAWAERLMMESREKLSEVQQQRLKENCRKKIERHFEEPSLNLPGGQPHVSDEQLLELFDPYRIHAQIEKGQALTLDRLLGEYVAQASINSRPFKDAKLSKPQVKALQSRVRKLFAEHHPDLKIVYTGTRVTTEARQAAAANPETIEKFQVRLIRAVEGIPATILEFLLGWADETPFAQHGDKSNLKQTGVTTDKAQKDPTTRTMRVLPVAEGGSGLHSLMAIGHANKAMSRTRDRYFDVDLIAAGKHVQPSWFAPCDDGSFPLGVTQEEIESMRVYNTECGRMTTEEWRKFLLNYCKDQRQRLVEMGIEQHNDPSKPFTYPLILLADAYSGHGVDSDTLELNDPECMKIAQMYNLRIVFYEHNTSTSKVCHTGACPLYFFFPSPHSATPAPYVHYRLAVTHLTIQPTGILRSTEMLC